MNTLETQLTARDNFDAASLTTSASPDRGLYATFGKRALDLLLVLMGGVVVLPLMLLLMALIALDGGRPVYRQRRIGRDGRIFTMLKLRTMVPGADQLLMQHLEENHADACEWRDRQKLSRDPRVTPIGRILRATSMDELPQLWNVLVGDMSLVGPRPMMISQREMYPAEAYYGLRPGITGPWQVSARHQSVFADRAEYDRFYRDRIGLFTDAFLLMRTLYVVLRGTGV